MPFVAPLALLGLVFVPLVVAMYMLKLRRDEAVVPSTLLWQRLLSDVEANAPWQRLRRSLLLLLQLLLVAILAILAARPFLERPAGLAGDLVVVIDTRASMGATDVAPNRLEAAKDAVVDALRDLPGGGRVSVIAAAGSARVVANGTTDLGRVRQAIARSRSRRPRRSRRCASGSRRRWRRGPAMPRSSSRPTPPCRRPPTPGSTPRSGSSGSVATRRNQAIVASRSGRRHRP